MTYSRTPLSNKMQGSDFRNSLNADFEELFAPDYLAYFGYSSGWVTTVPNDGAWHKVKYKPWPSDPLLIPTTSAGVMTFDSDACGIWVGTSHVAWDNTVSGLEAHARKQRVVIKTFSGFEVPVAASDSFFDPSLGTTGQMVNTHHQVAMQLDLDPANAPWTMWVEVWHNATVSGSPVDLDIELVGFTSPLLMLGRGSYF